MKRLMNVSLFIVVLVLFLANSTKGQDIVINEIMPANDTTYADENDDHEDWIELYNAGRQKISLKGYGLSDNPEEPFRWVFPDTTIAPRSFILIWASNKDRALGNEPVPFLKKVSMGIEGEEIPDPPRPLHTNYKIKSEGEPILLSDPSGKVVDEFEPVNIPDHISYGRYPDGAREKYYFTIPTPGKANNNSHYEYVTK